MKAIYQKCRAGLRDVELWPNYYETRYLEFRSVHSHWPSAKVGKLLEVGCGMGYVSAFLAQLAERVYATDIPEANPGQHAIGISKADAFLAQLATANVATQAVNAEEMPFEDDTFDVVFSMFVIQHIPDWARAAEEMARVVKPGGYAVHLVPSRTLLIYSFFRYWVYLARRSAVHSFRIAGIGRGKRRSGSATDGRPVIETIRSSGQFRHFPSQPVFGMYKSNREEWVESGLKQWQRLLSSHGRLRPLKAVTITLNPLPIITGMFVPGLGVKLFSAFRKLDGFLGRLPVLRHLGTNYLVILRKPGGTKTATDNR